MKKQTVLLVEENIQLRALLMQVLKEDYKIIGKSNLRETLGCVNRDHLPDLILIGCYSSQDDCPITTLRTNIFFRGIPILNLGSQVGTCQRVDCLKMGARDCLSKPFNPTELLFRMKQTLRSVQRLRPVL